MSNRVHPLAKTSEIKLRIEFQADSLSHHINIHPVSLINNHLWGTFDYKKNSMPSVVCNTFWYLHNILVCV